MKFRRPLAKDNETYYPTARSKLEARLSKRAWRLSACKKIFLRADDKTLARQWRLGGQGRVIEEEAKQCVSVGGRREKSMRGGKKGGVGSTTLAS